MAKLIITQVKSSIKRPARQKATLQALGLKKLHQTVEHEGTPQIMGMLNKVGHMVSYKEA